MTDTSAPEEKERLWLDRYALFAIDIRESSRCLRVTIPVARIREQRETWASNERRRSHA